MCAASVASAGGAGDVAQERCDVGVALGDQVLQRFLPELPDELVVAPVAARVEVCVERGQVGARGI
jgi:hypothetical protein